MMLYMGLFIVLYTVRTHIILKKSFSEKVSMSSATASLAIKSGLPYMLPLLQE